MQGAAISRMIRKKFFYTVEAAGEPLGLSRAQSYRAVALRQIPVERHGRFLLVPKRKWDAEVKRLLRGPSPTKRRRPRKAAPGAEASA
ncbi:hypothetical protein AS156_14250 [Bradyrhizobium macuxiense]|uniref:Uncharacterized protein n=1 Tax=Bradyrhizobium macuxiense TaxID=1755647 RepID=A0A109JK09_9BRAD|nr:hypothetical protein [Bradyrhizobium macuxiense]KWV50483.1 hypothetical protein AS156_14250 [Bradyrhizobium macuxiense]